jgi:SAM-dependent methyltransferase
LYISLVDSQLQCNTTCPTLAEVIESIKKGTPAWIKRRLKAAFWRSRILLFPSMKRPYEARETSKAQARRQREGFMNRFCIGRGIDIGYGGDPVTHDCDVWDEEHGDAHYLKGIRDHSYDFVYSSHTLEHLREPVVALQHWWRVLRPGGFLILYVPDRDLYEKKTTLPSRWNGSHTRFFLLDRDEKPDTLGILPLVNQTLDGSEVVYAKRCDEGHTIDDPSVHSDGEYSIEVVIQKKRTSHRSE